MTHTIFAALIAAGLSLSACGEVQFIDPKGSIEASVDENGDPKFELKFGSDFTINQDDEGGNNTEDDAAQSPSGEADKTQATAANRETENFNAQATQPIALAGAETDTPPNAVFFEANNIRYNFGINTVRDKPVDQYIMAELSRIVANLGGEFTIVVNSGGQFAKGEGPHTGSSRHDMDHHGYGQAVDFVLVRGGERLLPQENLDLYSALIEAAAQSFAGIGHYSWGIHVGNGAPAFWGPNLTSSSASPKLREAYLRGRAVHSSK